MSATVSNMALNSWTYSNSELVSRKLLATPNFLHVKLLMGVLLPSSRTLERELAGPFGTQPGKLLIKKYLSKICLLNGVKKS
jgi:hypothetical protein